MNPWVYALECIAVPCAIGVLMYACFGVLDRRRRRRSGDDGFPPVDYHI